MSDRDPTKAYLDCPCCYESYRDVPTIPEGPPDPEYPDERPVWWDDQRATCRECGCLVGVEADGERADAKVIEGCAAWLALYPDPWEDA